MPRIWFVLSSKCRGRVVEGGQCPWANTVIPPVSTVRWPSTHCVGLMLRAREEFLATGYVNILYSSTEFTQEISRGSGQLLLTLWIKTFNLFLYTTCFLDLWLSTAQGDISRLPLNEKKESENVSERTLKCRTRGDFIRVKNPLMPVLIEKDRGRTENEMNNAWRLNDHNSLLLQHTPWIWLSNYFTALILSFWKCIRKSLWLYRSDRTRVCIRLCRVKVLLLHNYRGVFKRIVVLLLVTL